MFGSARLVPTRSAETNMDFQPMKPVDAKAHHAQMQAQQTAARAELLRAEIPAGVTANPHHGLVTENTYLLSELLTEIRALRADRRAGQQPTEAMLNMMAEVVTLRGEVAELRLRFADTIVDKLREFEQSNAARATRIEAVADQLEQLHVGVCDN